MFLIIKKKHFNTSSASFISSCENNSSCSMISLFRKNIPRLANGYLEFLKSFDDRS